MNKRNFLYSAFCMMLAITACNNKLELRPETSIDADKAVENESNLILATSGNYSMMNSTFYITTYYHLTESATDNVEATGIFDPGGTREFAAYSFNHSLAMRNPSDVYTEAYKLLRGVNNVINNIPDDANTRLLQLKGENLFLRALAHYTLVNIFGRPYVQDNGNHPGVVIVDKVAAPLDRPAKRNTVKEVYDFMIADLLKAMPLMKAEIGDNAFASRYGAAAMLSSLYLNMDNPAKAVEYANTVINSGLYSLAEGDVYKKYFSTDHSTGDKETIFCMRSLDGTGSGYYYYNQSYTVEKFAAVSKPLLDLLDEGSGDVRKSFYKPLRTADGDEYTFTTKFVQNPVANPTEQVSSPAMYRLALMYLNRAEANARMGKNQEALDDVNLIRKRAGLSGSALYTLSQLHGRSSVLQVVLDERRIEFAFEGGIRRDDLWRNNLPMIRTYGKAGIPGSFITIKPTDKRVVYFLPQDETNGVSNSLEQNP